MFMIIVFLIGMILSVPYCFLAGWSPESQKLVAVLGSLFIFQWGVFAARADILEFHPSLRINWKETLMWRSNRPFLCPSAKVGFWAWTVMCVLPIILHWVAWLVGKVGQEHTSVILDRYRYAPVPICLVIILIGWMFWRKYIYPKELARDIEYIDCVRKQNPNDPMDQTAMG